jgi:hypothetical protein
VIRREEKCFIRHIFFIEEVNGNERFFRLTKSTKAISRQEIASLKANLLNLLVVVRKLVAIALKLLVRLL